MQPFMAVQQTATGMRQSCSGAWVPCGSGGSPPLPPLPGLSACSAVAPAAGGFGAVAAAAAFVTHIKLTRAVEAQNFSEAECLPPHYTHSHCPS